MNDLNQESSKQTNTIIIGKDNTLSHKRKTRLISFVTFAVVIALGTFIYFYIRNTNKLVSVNVCSSATLQQATTAISENKVIQLKQIVSKIQELPKYQKDPNCLYPIVTYYINISDVQNTRLYLNELEKVYNPKEGYSRYLGYNIKTIASLNNDLSVMEQNTREAQKNIVTFSNR